MKSSSANAFSQIRWLQPDGKPLSCLEKLKVLNENLEEIQEMCQEALEDAVLIGCDEAQVREVLESVVKNLKTPFKE